MINLSTKFEVYTLTHDKDTKGNTKSRNWGGFVRLGVTQGHQQQNHSIEHMQFPIPL